MARKTLLTEAQIRSFIKLANIGPVGDTKLQEWYDEGLEEQEEEEELEMDDEEEPERVGHGGGLPDMDAELGSDEMEMDAELGDDEMDMDAELGAPDELDVGPGGDKESEFMDLVQQLADMVGVEVDMEGGAEGEEEMGADLEGGEEAEEELPPMPGEEEAGMEAGMEAGEEEEEEELPGMRDSMYENTDKVVNEVARRVAGRLASENKKTKMVNDLAERIFNRLTTK